MKEQVNEITERLQQFKPSTKLYKVPFLGSFMTEGIRFLATKEEYYEIFMDMSIVARKWTKVYQPVSIDFKRLSDNEQDFTGHEVEVIYRDGNHSFLEKHGYRETDFPLDELRLFFVNDTLMLPSEY
ncbi:hypothetical protein J8281_06260 [Aquimarina sp. U1-2]|uniref:DUF6876 family protein n=1 Tax=Aquimarina sp. U1-2 TaxID=2823141 RepID=UPI001AECCA89|nr:DUF6876 family protein [Aquimarina sp. U1-2]MBP2831787.1 hypothetical protein [Aquimarina sp. U1-2]